MFAIHLSESYFRGLYFAEVDIYIFQVWAAFNLRSRSRWHPQFPKGHEGIPKHHLQPFNWLIKISSRTVSHTNSHFFTKSWYFLQFFFNCIFYPLAWCSVWNHLIIFDPIECNNTMQASDLHWRSCAASIYFDSFAENGNRYSSSCLHSALFFSDGTETNLKENLN